MAKAQYTETVQCRNTCLSVIVFHCVIWRECASKTWAGLFKKENKLLKKGKWAKNAYCISMWCGTISSLNCVQHLFSGLWWNNMQNNEMMSLIFTEAYSLHITQWKLGMYFYIAQLLCTAHSKTICHGNCFSLIPRSYLHFRMAWNSLHRNEAWKEQKES